MWCYYCCVVGKLEPMPGTHCYIAYTTKHLIFALSVIWINELTHRLNNKRDKQSSCKTPRSTGIDLVINSLVRTEILKFKYKFSTRAITSSEIWWANNIARIKLWWTSPKAFFILINVPTWDLCLFCAWLITYVDQSSWQKTFLNTQLD